MSRRLRTSSESFQLIFNFYPPLRSKVVFLFEIILKSMVRILVCGDATDRFESVHKKLEVLITENGPFDVLLLTTPLGKISSPVPSLSIPTYFAALSHEASSLPRQIAPNLQYVGPSAKFQVSSLSFLLSTAGAPLDSLSALIRNANSPSTVIKSIGNMPFSEQIDIREKIPNSADGYVSDDTEKADSDLQTQVLSQSYIDVVVTTASPLSDDVFAAHARKIGLSTYPRYHFSAAQAFVSMPPLRYRPAHHSTRVISIAPACKGRWVYAIDIQSLSECPNATLPSIEKSYNHYDYTDDQALAHAKFGVYRSTGSKRPHFQDDDSIDYESGMPPSKRIKTMEDRCWFCIGDALEPHLIVLRGKHIVATVAKGALHKSHLVIVPAAHIESSSSVGFSQEGRLQLMDVLNAVARLYSTNFPGCFPYLFERSGGESEDARIRHMHIQAVAVEKKFAAGIQERCVELARNFGVEARIQMIEEESNDTVKGAKLGLESVREHQLDQFFWAQLSINKFVVIRFSGGCTVPVHFGRMIVAEAMGDTEATDWRKRVVSSQEEGRLALNLNAILRKTVVEMRQR